MPPASFSPLSLQIIVSCTLQSLCTYKPNSYFTGNWSSLWRAPLQEEERKGEPHICSLLVSVLWRLASCRIGTLSAGVLSYGLRHPEHTLHALADTVHAFQLHSDADMVWIIINIYGICLSVIIPIIHVILLSHPLNSIQFSCLSNIGLRVQ